MNKINEATTLYELFNILLDDYRKLDNAARDLTWLLDGYESDEEAEEDLKTAEERIDAYDKKAEELSDMELEAFQDALWQV